MSISEGQRQKFLLALSDTGNVKLSAQASGLCRSGWYVLRRDDPEFAKLWDEAMELGVEGLEDEAIRRAHDGVEKPIFHNGKQCGSVREYSDVLLMFLLKGRKPEKYRDNKRVEHTMSDSLADRLAAARKRVHDER